MSTRRLLTPLALALGLTLALFWGLGDWIAPVEAMPRAAGAAPRDDHAPLRPQTELHVCPSGCAYDSIQDAVDAAPKGGLIKVAEGTYSDWHWRERSIQVVHIAKSVTIQGGYAAGDWSTPDPDAHPTVVDAQGWGHAVNISTYIGPASVASPSSQRQAGSTTSISVTVSGLHMTGGSESGCGGVWVWGANATLTDNRIYGNTGDVGGGVCVEQESTVLLSRNVISGNVADANGGGLYAHSSQVSLVNNVIVDNQAGEAGTGAYLTATTASLIHTTVARNGSNGSTALAAMAPAASSDAATGIHVGSTATAALTNTILASQTVGIEVESNGSAHLNGVLWSGNGANTAGAGAISASQEVSGTPGFAADGYHIGAGSAAIEQGVDAGVTDDIDGEGRPQGSAPDLGADEYSASATGAIVIQKATDPPGGTGFAFTGDLGPFSLDHGEGQTFDDLAPGTYAVAEDDPSPAFDLTGLACVETVAANSATDLGARQATVQLDPGETVTCTFSNTERGAIVIQKATDPAGGTGFAFSGDLGAFSLDHGDGQTFDDLAPGTYAVAEDDPAPAFDLTGLTCVETVAANSATDLGTRQATVQLDPGETVTCTFTNTEPGAIVIQKATDPPGGTGFAFSGDLGPFTLDHGDSDAFSDLPSGDYDVVETDSPEWTLTGVVCVGGDDSPLAGGVTVHLGPGERITCTFSNLVSAPPTGESTDAAGLAQDAYTPGETIHAAGSGFVPQTQVNVHVVEDLAWADGMPIPVDVSNDGPDTVATDGTGDLGPAPVWSAGLIVGAYDLVFDADRDGQYDAAIDVVHHAGHPGFVVEPISVLVTPEASATLAYTDAQGLPTAVEVPPLAVGTPLTLSFSPLLAPSHALPVDFAHHAFELAATFPERPAAITVTKSADPTQVAEPGGEVAFTVVITNTSWITSAAITSLVDSPYGDVTDPANPRLAGTTCGMATLPAAHCYRCTFTATVSGPPGDLVTDTVTVGGVGGDGTPLSAQDSAAVAVTDVASSILVTKTATVTELMEPGGPVTFTLEVANRSAADAVTLQGLQDDPYGDLTDPQNPSLLGTTCQTTTMAPDEVYRCAFRAMVTGSPGELVTDTVTVNGIDDDGQPVQGSDGAAVTILDLPSDLAVTKTATPSELPEPGGPVTFSLWVENLSAADTITLTALTDDRHGDLDGQGSCALPQRLAPAASYRCAFTATVRGNAGDSETDTVTASAVDDDGQALSHHDSAVVAITDVPSDIRVTKTAAPDELLAPGGTVTFSLLVENLSAVDVITLTHLADDPHGDLTDPQNPDLLGTTCQTSTLAPNDVYRCAFTAMVTGSPGELVTDTVTVNGIDDDGQPVQGSDGAAVSVTANRIYLPLVMRDRAGGRFTLDARDAPSRGPITPPRRLPREEAGCSLEADGPYPCLSILQRPITITIHYSAADVQGLDEGDLRLYRWSGSQWEDAANTCSPPSAYTRDVGANVLQVPVCRLGQFALGE